MLLLDLEPFCYHYFQRLTTFWGVVTFGWLKRVLHMGDSKNKIAKNVKGILFLEKVQM